MHAASLALALGAIAASPMAAGDGGSGPRYRVEIVAPSPLKDAFERSLDLVRWQDYADLTPEFLDLLIGDAKAQAQDAAEAEGYFSASIVSELDPATTPPTVRIRAEPGEPTRIADIVIKVTGPAADDGPRAGAQIARMQAAWLLPKGALFRQADWTNAKTAAVAMLASDRYATARLVQSEAAVDPAEHAARLSITIDSGPAFHLGALEISGLKKYSEQTVRSLLTFSPGDPYTQGALDAFARRLNTSGYFASAQATLVTDTMQIDAAPVRLTLIEAPRHRFTAGIGFSTDTLYRGQLSYDDVNLANSGLQFHTDLVVDSKEQNATARFTLPPRDPAYTDSLSATLQHTDIAGLATKDLYFGGRRRTADERDQRTYSATYYVSQQQPQDADSRRAHALYFEYGRTWRRLDDLLSPTRGYVVNTQVGAAPPGVSSRGFGRGIVQWAAFVPIDLKTQLMFKAEGGAVAASASDGVPEPLLFRTGGDTTVRGYSYLSLGPRVGNTTIGGRYYAIATGEVVRWIGANWGLATFVDAGNAADRARDLKPVYGYGIGVRVRTPIGPFRLDLAYGEAAKTVRVHLSLGLSF